MNNIIFGLLSRNGFNMYISSQEVGFYILIVSEMHKIHALARRHNFSYAYYVTTYLALLVVRVTGDVCTP